MNRLARTWLGGALWFVTPVVMALDVTITAQYLGGGTGRFDNTTPPGGLCSSWGNACRNRTTVTLPITYDKKTTKGAVDPRDHFYVSLPARREVDVYHDITGESRRLTFEWTALSQHVQTSGSIYDHPLYNRILSGGVVSVGTFPKCGLPKSAIFGTSSSRLRLRLAGVIVAQPRKDEWKSPRCWRPASPMK